MLEVPTGLWTQDTSGSPVLAPSMKSALFRSLSLRILQPTLRLLLVLLAGLMGPLVWADGKVFPPAAIPTEVTIPDQRALIRWSKGVEHLVIETRLAGSGTNFAWVVPLPSPPTVAPATSGLFPTLEHLLQPTVIHAATAWWLLGLFGIAMVFLLLTVRRTGNLKPGDVVGAAVLGFSVGAVDQGEWVLLGLATFLISVLALEQVRRRGLGIWDVLVLCVLLFLVASLLLPALAKASAKGGSPETLAGITILDRQWAGVYETTTLTGRDGRSLREWFQREGYSFSPSVVPVFEEYLRDGWVFVASKVRRDVAVGTNSLPPLSFTFATPQPVYPLRLTGVDNGNLDVELFVFGPERARADGFSVRTCRPVSHPPTDPAEIANWYPTYLSLPLLHPGLKTAVGNAAYVTRLRATLTPGQMRQDALLQWDGFAERQEVLYSARGAFTTAANGVLGIASLAAVSLILVPTWRRRIQPSAGRWFLAGALLMTALIGFSYLWFPVVPVRLESGRDWLRSRGFRLTDSQYALQFAIQDTRSDTNSALVTVDVVRETLREYLPFHLQRPNRPPFPTPREEDSPGNYTLRTRHGGVDLLLYNGWGGVIEVPLPP